MSKFATLAADGTIIGFYDPEIHTEIPADAIPISEEEWGQHVGGTSLYFDGEAFVLITISVNEAKQVALDQMVAWIDRLTEQLRAGIPRDEVASWPSKSAEAKAVLEGATVAPILQAEADLIGSSLREVAETIVARTAFYETVVGAVAGIRRNTVAAIDAATDAEGVALALDEALATASAKATELGLVVAG